MLQSRGFSSRCAETDYTPLESDRFREAILGSGHTFKNSEEFRNAIYQMSLGNYSFPIISEELVSLYGTHLTRGNLGCFEGSHWIGNEVNLISNLLYPISVHIFTIYWSIIYMGVYL